MEHIPGATVGRVWSIPIVETERTPRRLLFEGDPDKAEGFFLDLMEDPEVDPFYIELETDASQDPH